MITDMFTLPILVILNLSLGGVITLKGLHRQGEEEESTKMLRKAYISGLDREHAIIEFRNIYLETTCSGPYLWSHALKVPSTCVN